MVMVVMNMFVRITKPRVAKKNPWDHVKKKKECAFKSTDTV